MESGEPAEARGAAPLDWLLGFIVAVVGSMPTLGRLMWSDFAWMPWSDRDLVRSQGLGALTETMGAELSYGAGARVPGGVMHLLYGVPLALGAGPEGAYRAQAAGEVLGLVVLGGWLVRFHGPLAGALFMALWASTDLTAHALAGLWNPAWVVPFSMVATAAALEQARAPRVGLGLLFGVACALAAQNHLSALLFAGVAGLFMAGWAARKLLALSEVVVGLVVPFLPYLAVEVMTGWPNTLMLVQKSQLADVVEVERRGVYLGKNLDAVARLVAGMQTLDYGDAPQALLVFAWFAAVACVGAGVLAVVRLRGAAGRAALGMWAAALATVVWFVTSSRVQLDASGSSRYFLAVLPGVLASLGMAVAAGPASVGRAIVLAAGLGAVPYVAIWSLKPPYLSESAMRFSHLRNGLRGLELVTPYRGRDLLRRTVVLTMDWTPHRGDIGVEALFGSAPVLPPAQGTCAYIYSGVGRQPLGRLIGEERLIDAMPAGATEVRVLEGWRVAERVRVALYEVDGSPCPSSFSNRYVPVGVEPHLRAIADELADGDVRAEVPGAPGWLATRVGHAVVGVHLAVQGGEVVARLEANALRGKAYNDGWFTNVTMDHLRLEFSRDGEQVELPLSTVPVGGSGVLAPLEAAAAVGPGPWRVTLRGEVQEVDVLRARGRGGAPFERTLVEAWSADAAPPR